MIGDQPITISDDGCGMTYDELRRQYLVIVFGRRQMKSEKTPQRQRHRRGKNGIGKFAGLVVAELMHVETRSEGQRSTLEIRKSWLPVSQEDLDTITIPLTQDSCEPSEHGTTITLSQPDSRNPLPTAEGLKEVLALDFGRREGFTITVNGQRVTHEDIPGESIVRTASLPIAGKVTLRFTIMGNSKGVKNSGVVSKVGDKILGKPRLFGLESDDEIPRKLLDRVVGEIEVAAFTEAIASARGKSILNIPAFKEVQEWARRHIKASVSEAFTKEISLAKARRQKQINEQLARLPEHRRPLASKALDNVMRKFFGESEDKIDVIISLVLEAFERDDYWIVCQKIEDADRADVAALAEVLQEFGLVDLIYTGQQARHRLQFLDHVDSLMRDKSTLEVTMHKALEKNVWIFGLEYTLISSNKSLAKTIDEYTGGKFSGKNARKRPDLFLGRDFQGRCLLIEFKRPSHVIDRDDVNQAERYRDDLTPIYGKIDILIVGGTASLELCQYPHDGVEVRTYRDLISRARIQLDWLVEQLRSAT